MKHGASDAIPTPITLHTHDSFIKKALSYPRVALEFFLTYLPTDLVQQIDL